MLAFWCGVAVGFSIALILIGLIGMASNNERQQEHFERALAQAKREELDRIANRVKSSFLQLVKKEPPDAII